MRVYLTPPQPSRGLQRIADALTKYAPPSVEVVEHIGGADMVILYAIGRRDALQRLTEAITKSKFQKYAIIQVCLRSTMAPKVDQRWLDIWLNAQVVWSYYDLDRICVEDGWSLEHDGDSMFDYDQFYHAPLGADGAVFYPREGRRDIYVIATNGVSRLSESVRECALAAEQAGKYVFHVGKHLRLGRHVDTAVDVSDDFLAEHLSSCEFVSGLRRTEGFELPAVEGLLCGSRPILFNSDTYRRWYEPWGEFIEETDRQGVVDQLVELFKRGARPVTAEEREQAVERFNWETIIKGFYERII